MTQVAKVESNIDSHYAKISVSRQTACGHSCENCGGCGITGGTKVYAVAKNLIGAKDGDTVIVESSSKKVLGVVALVYVLPFIGLFLCYGIGVSLLSFAEFASGVLAVVGFCLFMIPAFVYNKRVKKTGELNYSITRFF